MTENIALYSRIGYIDTHRAEVRFQVRAGLERQHGVT
jgi:hypothetical protein